MKLNSFFLFIVTFVLISTVTAQKNPVRIAGKVSDNTGTEMPAVSVIVKGTTTGTITDANGSYSIEVPAEKTNPVLVFSQIGSLTIEEIVGNRRIIDVVLMDDSKLLSEVVVTALGIKREEKALGYSVQKIGGDDIGVTKGVNLVSSLNGKVSGMKIENTTEISEKPKIKLRGEEPLIVIDGVAYTNLTLNDLSQDDIENIDVLKGATASALYGDKGRNGAVMVTTKTGKGKKGLNVTVSNNTMFRAGYLKLPESQNSYSSGNYGKLEYGSGYVWGDYMDGHEVEQYDPVSKGLKVYPLRPVGKDNFKNFLQQSFITNTNVSVSQSGELGTFRVSGTQVHQKGQWPNTKIDKFIFNAGGSIKYNKFSLDASLGYKRENSPNMPKVDYGGGNYLYNMLIWTGKEINILDYKDYWKVKDQVQNWPWDGWYDNPYFLAYESINKKAKNLLNAQTTASYEISDNLKIVLRSGVDNYSNQSEFKRAMGYSGDKKGYYSIQEETGWSSNSDFFVNGNKTVGDFKFDILVGTGIDYLKTQNLWGETRDGLSVPGFYSLEASNEPANVKKEYKEKVVYSLYTKFSTSWKDAIYLDLTGRNDWASTLSKDERSYFYPSAGLSVLPTNFYNPESEVLDYWKVRTSWTVSKKIADPFEILWAYDLEKNKWDGKTSATYPKTGRDPLMKPETQTTIEIGTDFRFFKNRLGIDFTYFSQLYTNRIVKSDVSKASGLEKMFVNTQEDLIKKGMEFTIKGTPVENKSFTWNSAVNLSFWKTYVHKFDSIYSDEHPLKGKGSRTDQIYTYDWQRDPQGNIVHQNGLPVKNSYQSRMGFKDPDLILGFINSFTFKDFTLNMVIDGSFGGTMFSWTEQAMWHSGAHPDSDNQWRRDEVVNKKKNYIGKGVKVVSGELVHDKYGNVISDTRKFAPNDVETSYQGYITHYNNNAWDHYAPQNMIDPSFVKLRELSINYNIPAVLVSKMKLKSLQVGIVGQNLLMWTKQSRYSDPDRRGWDGNENLNSPSERYLGFNINLSF